MSRVKWSIDRLYNPFSRVSVVRYGLLMCLLLGQLLVTIPAYADEESLPVEYRPLVQAFIDVVRMKDHQAIASYISYPLRREYPVTAIQDQQDMLARFDEVFDETMLDTIAQSRAEQDWRAVGWRGIMLGNGEVWMDYNGKIIGINYQTDSTARLKADLIVKQKMALHPGLREYERPELMWQTERFTIRIDNMGDNHYRYASWAKGKPLSDKPDLVLKNGEVRFEGSGGNQTYQFSSGPYQYECQVNVIGVDSSPGDLVVYKNGVEILRQPVLKSL